jgi:sugar phosphate isomerase/epimerase
MSHPRLSVNALSSINWSFDQDLAFWQELGIRHAGLLVSKFAEDRETRAKRLQASGIIPSTLVMGSFALGKPETWEATRSAVNASLDAMAAMGGGSVYFTPGRTTGARWREVLSVFVEAVSPCVAHARCAGVTLAIEPSLRTDVSFVNTLRDAIDVAELTGLKLIADFGNCWMERDLAEVLRRAGPHIGLVQICDMRIGGPGGRVHLGEGDLPLKRLMHEVLDSGYTGVFDLEVLGPSIEQEGYAAALRRGVRSASAFLADVLK